MSNSIASNPYQTQIVEHADKLKLVELLYEGSLRFMRRAVEAIDQLDPEAAHHAILRAYAIVAELQATLDMEQGGAIAVNLERCYDFVLVRLKDANIQKQIRPLEDAIRVIEPLLAAWQQAHASAAPAATVLAAPRAMPPLPASGADNGKSELKLHPEPVQRAIVDVLG